MKSLKPSSPTQIAPLSEFLHNLRILGWRRRLNVILVFITITFSIAGISIAAPGSTSVKNLNQIMTEIGGTMLKMFPLVYSEEKLSPAQNLEIHQTITHLQALFSQAEPYIMRKSPAYQMSYQILQDYLDSITTDNPVNLPHIKSRLITLGDFCVSCHTQDNKFRSLFAQVKTPKLSSNLAYAEFNYATRNYLEAQKYYEKHLLLTPKLDDSEALKILHRILSIYVQILNQPKQALEIINRIKSSGTYSPDITEYLSGISNALKKLTQADHELATEISFFKLESYVTKYLGDSNAQQPFIFTSPKMEIERLWLRGMLFRYLNTSPKPDEMPKILYWLALCDRSLGYGYDYTLADFYIKQCITRYSSHPYAHRCFAEYKSYVEFYFTTPTEPVLPFEINKELKALQKHLKF